MIIKETSILDFVFENFRDNIPSNQDDFAQQEDDEHKNESL